MTLRCIECGQQTETLSTRTRKGNGYSYITRRRECPLGHRFTTRELPVQTFKSVPFLKKLVRKLL